MRGAGIGLLSLLVVAAIIMFVMFSGPGGGYMPTVLHKGKQGQDTAQQISGHTASGRPVSESAKFSEVDGDDRSFRRVKVDSLDADCPLLLNYHMQVGDEITEVGGTSVRDNNDYGLAVSLIQQSWQEMKSLKFERNGVTWLSTPDGPLTQQGGFAPAGLTSMPSP